MITVLRLNHRISRDKRLSTHVMLSSRAFGVSEAFYSGEKDSSLENSINGVVNNFGGSFKINFIKSPLNFLKSFKGLKIHLTMYGLSFEKEIIKLKKNKENLLLIIGSSKVNSEFFEHSDINLSIGNQPHSEVAALSIFLYELFSIKILTKNFKNPKIKIEPSNFKNIKKL